jgi:hypothetical protein
MPQSCESVSDHPAHHLTSLPMNNARGPAPKSFENSAGPIELEYVAIEPNDQSTTG